MLEEARGGGREVGGGRCSVGGSGGDNSEAGRVEARPAAVVVMEIQWGPDLEPGAGFGRLSGLG